MQTAKDKFLDQKFHEIKKMGVRKNTHAPVSKNNPRRAVGHKQAVAIVMETARKKGFKV